METIDIKEEDLEQMSNTMSIHESNKSREFLMVHERINLSSFATVSDKNEAFQPEVVLRLTSQSEVLPSKPTDTENEVFQSEMEKEIVKIFEEFDIMSLYDYDQTRVRKVKELVEKYQRITQEVIVKLHENTLEVKANELNKIKEDLKMAESTNMTLSKRIEEMEMERNQASGRKKSLKPDLNLNSESKSKPEEKNLSASQGKEKNVVLEKQVDPLPLVFESQEMNVNPNKTLQSDNQIEVIIGNQIEVVARVKNKKKKYKYTFTCPRCGKVLHSKHSLTAHIETVHEKLKNFKCELCIKAFGKKHDLNVHVGRRHKRHIK